MFTEPYTLRISFSLREPHRGFDESKVIMDPVELFSE